VPAAPGSADTPTNVKFDREKYVCVQDASELQSWVDRAMTKGVVAVVGVCLAVDDNEACYIPLAHVGAGNTEDSGDMFGAAPPKQIPLQAALDILEPMLHAPHVLKIGQNFKYDLGVFQRYEGNGKALHPAPYDDTMLISYALEAGLRGHGMDAMSDLYFGHTAISFKEIAGTGKKAKTFDEIELDVATPYAAEDADVTLRLWKFLKPKLAGASVAAAYETLDRPLPAVAAKMENEGIFNIGSPKQIGEILFDNMGLTGGKKTKTGAWKTGVDVLEALADAGEALPRIVLDWRQYSKLKSTYTDALVAQINPATNRVHTSYSLAATTTGRLSSSDPNLQNIPIRTEMGRKIRDAFVAEAGHRITRRLNCVFSPISPTLKP